MKNGFYDDVRFFRVIAGLHGAVRHPRQPGGARPRGAARNLKDDPVKQSNKRGYRDVRDRRSEHADDAALHQLRRQHAALDKQGFAPFGEVVQGMDVVDKIYDGYGEGAPRGKGPDQGRMQTEGNAYLNKEFPRLDFIKAATIASERPRWRTVTLCSCPSSLIQPGRRLTAWPRHGDERDPFAVLGPHRTAGGIVIRALQPAARSIDVRLMANGVLLPMRRSDEGDRASRRVRDPAAGRRARLPAARSPTRSGHVVEIDDPYRYGRVLTDFDLHLFGEGTHHRAFEKLGAHRVRVGSTVGRALRGVGAQRGAGQRRSATSTGGTAACTRCGCSVPSGVWEAVRARPARRREVQVRDPHAGRPAAQEDRSVRRRLRGAAADRVGRPRHLAATSGATTTWMATRPARGEWLDRPMSVYEVHLGSWARVPEERHRSLTYRELAERLVPYVKELGFTHIELLPVMEHPFAGSWGYQVIGFFAPTSRFGPPEDFKAFVDACHQAGIGVILDWVPGHFPKDAHGLARVRRHGALRARRSAAGRAPGLGHAHLQLRPQRGPQLPAVERALLARGVPHRRPARGRGGVDAVPRLLAPARASGCRTAYGGRENLEAIDFLQQLNALTHGEHPGTITVAEESTAWPGVSRPVHLGGLGFTYKWNMGWMHDMLRVRARRIRCTAAGTTTSITFSMLYAFTENFVLPFSHDEVVHGKGAMLDKMPGDVWQKYATLRALYGFMYGHPGKKLLFMGGEFGQWREWNHDGSLDWHLLDDPAHAGLQPLRAGAQLALPRRAGAARAATSTRTGFRWIDCNDNENSVVSFVRCAQRSGATPL